MTAKGMIPAIGMAVLVRFESCQFRCEVEDVKSAYGAVRLLVTPVSGIGQQWVAALGKNCPRTRSRVLAL